MDTKMNCEQESEEVMMTEEEIRAYSGCTTRTQMCLSDCPWPFPGTYISSGE
ncbi:pseudouridine synthase [Anaerocolumna xylanovorans]|uniref:Uncharacterized protein n=1 Tax=Anaerocolumna xylanovorans DSM 12503 TaxID=1121345 RepID=A0A1M7Y966_9FIRM|nr:pseudouridine synthase [Anaerocolumna xylanovorans]SHO49121.1 hypothetical protein SAMN02745217_02135 [Anaerocolumna xylanovorans DSM 12503]